MDIPYIAILVLCGTLVFISIRFDKSRQKQINNIQEEFKGLLSFTESLKFRVYDHERQLLNKEGVFVPEDTGMFVFNLIWGMLDEETKENIEKEYTEVCPSNIPLWKYVLYSYKLTPKIERKIELRKVESMDDLLNSVSKKTMEDVNKVQDQIGHVSNKLLEVQRVLEDKESS